MERKKPGRPANPEGYEYKHKRAVSLTDKQFEEAKSLFGSATEAVLYAIKIKKYSKPTKN